MIKSNKIRHFSYLMMIIFIFMLIVIGLSSGFVKIPFNRVIGALIGKATAETAFTIFTLRLPRVLITLIMGMALALSGLILQTITKNDLADPGIIGINAGAGLGVTIAYLVFQFNIEQIVFLIPLFAFIGAVSTFMLTIFFSRENGVINVDKLILLGIGSAIALSGLMIVLISSAERDQVQFIQAWLSGDIWGDKMIFVQIISPIILLTILMVYAKAKILNILNLDLISAQSLGVDIKIQRFILTLLAVILASVVVSVGGSISFVGLIIPHIAKRLYGADHRHSMIATVLLGGIFLMAADLIGRSIFLPEGILPGIVVALIGSPYFLYLLLRTPTDY